ncbi:MAG: type II toxin-antitoxin system MqsA family antitoxin [Desulfococcaceae bacterium]
MVHHNAPDLCPLCGGRKKPDVTTFMADVDGAVIVIKEVPATICSLCGNEWFDDFVARNIECAVQEAKEKGSLFDVLVYSDRCESEHPIAAQ